MLVSFYVGTSDGIAGYLDIIIRKFLRGDYSHLELVFEESDNVHDKMHDGYCGPDSFGRHWCGSSSFVDKIPDYSPKRAGKQGGVRLKRININTPNWVTIRVPGDALSAASWFREHEGSPYALREIPNQALPIFKYVDGNYICSRAVAEALGFKEGVRFDPCNLYPVLERLSLMMLLEPIKAQALT